MSKTARARPEAQPGLLPCLLWTGCRLPASPWSDCELGVQSVVAAVDLEGVQRDVADPQPECHRVRGMRDQAFALRGRTYAQREGRHLVAGEPAVERDCFGRGDWRGSVGLA